MPAATQRPRVALLTEDGVQHLLRGTPQAAMPLLQVVELRRLALDASWLQASKEKDRPECGDAFDVTLSDGVHKLKCVLSTALNGKAYRGSLHLALIVRVVDWRKVVDERIDAEGSGPPVVVLTQLDEVRTPDIGLLNNRPAGDDLACHPDALVGGAEAQARQSAALPLLGVRKHYLRVEADEVLLTERWTQNAVDADNADEPLPAADSCPVLSRANRDAKARAADSSALRVMGDAQQGAGSARPAGAPPSKGPAPPLIGRVKRVGPLQSFGGLHEQSALAYPTYFTFWLWDGTSEAGLPVMVWNRKCEELYAMVCAASLVVVSGYRIAVWKTGFEEGQVEWRAMINTQKPTGQVRAVTYGEVLSEWGDATAKARLPELPAAISATRSFLQRQARIVARADADGGAEGGGAGGASLALAPPGGGDEPDASASEEHAKLVDLACVVVRAFAPFRARVPASARRAARFRRARWLSVLLADGQEPVPVLLYAHHVAAHDELKVLFPEADPSAQQASFPVGRPLVLRNLSVVDAGVRLDESGGSGGSGGRPGPSNAADDDDDDEAGRVMMLCSAPGSRVVIPSPDATELGPPGTSDIDDLAIWWATHKDGRKKWASACRAYETGVPASLERVHFVSLPDLGALTHSTGFSHRPQRMLTDLLTAVPSLHADEVCKYMLKAILAPPTDASTFGAIADSAVPGGWSLAVRLVDVNDPSNALSATLALHDGHGAGTEPSALWRALSRAAALANGQRVQEPPARCNKQSILSTAKKLEGKHLAIALDIYKRGAGQPVSEVAAVYFLAAAQPQQPPQPQPQQQPQQQRPSIVPVRKRRRDEATAEQEQPAPRRQKAAAPAKKAAPRALLRASPALTRHRLQARTNAPAKKAAPAKKGQPARKKAQPAAKKAAPARKAQPARKAAPAKKAQPKKAAPAKAAPAKKASVAKTIAKKRLTTKKAAATNKVKKAPATKSAKAAKKVAAPKAGKNKTPASLPARSGRRGLRPRSSTR